MASYTGKNICNTFKSILNVGGACENNCILPTAIGDRIIVTDGTGIDSAVCIARAGGGILVNGQLDVSCGNIVVAGDCSVNACVINQNGKDGSVNVDGDLFVGAGTTTTFSVNNECGSSSEAPGLVYAKGPVNVGQGHAVNSSTGAVDTTCNTLYNHGTIFSCGTIFGGGDIVAFSSSDERLKDDINKIESSKEIIDGINGYTFTWKEDAELEGKSLGVIAQEVKEVLPEIVHERDSGMLAVDYIKLIPVLIEEVKRLSKEVEDLKNA